MENRIKVKFPRKLPLNSDIFCLLFSSEKYKINGTIVCDGVYSTRLIKNEDEWVFEHERKAFFQGLLIVQTGNNQWVSNIFFYESFSGQGPWLLVELKEEGAHFTLNIDTECGLGGNMIVSSDHPVKLDGKVSKIEEDEWLFKKIPQIIEGTKKNAQETTLSLNIESSEGFATSCVVVLNEKKGQSPHAIFCLDLKEKISRRNIQYIKIKGLPERFCLKRSSYQFEDEVVITGDDLGQSYFYFIGALEKEVKCEVFFTENGELMSENIFFSQNDVKKLSPEPHKCLSCEERQQCPFISAIIQGSKQVPWVKFLK